jgi:hypothetical protein
MDKEKEIEPHFGLNSKDNHFIVPENYFKNFSGRLQEKLDNELFQAEKPEKAWGYSPRFAYAIVIVFLAMISYPVIRYFSHEGAVKETNMVSLVNYSIENIETDLLVDGITLDEISFPANGEPGDTMIDYIENQGIELENITDQL